MRQIWLSLFLVSLANASCLSDLLALKNNQTELLQVLYYMGKGINDLGEYSKCLQNPNLHYLLLTVKSNSGPGSVNVGLCLPLSCTPDDFSMITD